MIIIFILIINYFQAIEHKVAEERVNYTLATFQALKNKKSIAYGLDNIHYVCDEIF